MNLLILLALIGAAVARVVEEKCEGLQIRNVNHEIEVLKDNLNFPYQLTVDTATKILFFSLIGTDEDDTLSSAYLNLETKEFGRIPGINGSFANAVDAKNHIVYLGGSEGIYTFDFDAKVAKYVANAGNVNIWQMFYKDRLYFTEYPTGEVYYYEDGETKRVEVLKNRIVEKIAVDNDNNMFFSDSSDLFVYKKENAEILKVGEYNVNGFTADINGNLYFSTEHAIYSINGQEALKLVELGRIYGLAIDAENNIIYAESDKILRLLPKACASVNEESTDEK